MSERLVVETSQGRTKGHLEAGVCSWKGIPYAASPAGAGRFAHAGNAPSWAGVRECDSFGSACAQVSAAAGGTIGSEDCLFLNVWASDTDEQRKPVLVFLHGGSFCQGSGADDEINGARLAQSGDCVVVNLNYRLGALGVLDFSFLDEDFRANCCVSDVLAALRWVHENISAFGGDPDNVTLFGQSAGAILTSMLPVMPAARGLVSRGILMSAGPTLPANHDKQVDLSERFLSFMGIQDKDRLFSMDAGDLVARQKEFARHVGMGSGTFMPEIDGQLVTQYPVAAAAAGQASPIPLLIGTTREEMSFLYIKPVARALDIEGIMSAGVDAESEQVRKHISQGYERYGRRGRAVLVSDLVFRIGSTWLAQAMSAHADVWMYRFDYETLAMRVSGLHSFHSSDLPFVFGNHGAGHAPLMFCFSPSRRGIQHLTSEMQADFMQFAREGILPWPKCQDGEVPAKCYRRRSVIEPAVPADVLSRYDASNFKARSFAGVSNNLR